MLTLSNHIQVKYIDIKWFNNTNRKLRWNFPKSKRTLVRILFSFYFPLMFVLSFFFFFSLWGFRVAPSRRIVLTWPSIVQEHVYDWSISRRNFKKVIPTINVSKSFWFFFFSIYFCSLATSKERIHMLFLWGVYNININWENSLYTFVSLLSR